MGISNICLRRLVWTSAILTVVVLFGATPILAQQYASQDGRLLDANNRIGSFGLNSSVSTDTLTPRMNSYITGNVTGGARFQGFVPYGSTFESSGYNALGTLSDFRRDSTSQQTLTRGVAQPSFYVDSSRSITRTFGNQVMTTQTATGQPVARVYAPVNAFGGISNTISSQQFAGSYAPLGVGTQYSAPALNNYGQIDTTRPANINPQWRFQVRNAPQEEALEQDGESILQLPPPTAYNQIGEETEEAATGSGEFVVAAASPYEQAMAAIEAEHAAQAETALSQAPAGEQDQEQSESPEPTAMLARTVISVDQSTDYFTQYFNQGIAYMGQGQFYNAVTALENASLFDGPSELADLALAHALFGAGDFMSSAYYLNRVFTYAPELAAVQTNLADLFGQSEIIQTRLESLQTWYERSNEPILLFLKGYILYQQNDIDGARAALDTAAQETAEDTPSITVLLNAINQAEY
ncbi:MAG: hypothetical protein JW936_09910 [Sedimentisphaerales bacterium]|nr:hypothetical protein [Sedimentisphaerales bacterium]